MNAKEIREEFLRSTRRVNQIPEKIEWGEIIRVSELRLKTIIISQGHHHVLRRRRPLIAPAVG